MHRSRYRQGLRKGLSQDLRKGKALSARLRGDRKALRNILTEPKNAVIRQYIKLFEMDQVTLTFEEEVFDYIVDKAIEFHLGARGLRSICETIMMDLMFEVPSQKKKSITITKKYAESKLNKIQAQKLRA